VSTPAQRQQTKWVVFGLAVALVLITVILAVTLLVPISSTVLFLEMLVTTSIWPVAMLLIPVSVGFSIFHYRLYDIDVLINRTLVYGLLTGILGALYAGLIIGLESLARLFGGQAANNSVTLILSTLVIAVLFLPVRRRMQAFIDRRFYRRKYDAEKTLVAFSVALRQQVDLNQIQAHLLGVVQETMQPSHSSLWLRAPVRKHPRPEGKEP
jgi:hypothetical protein